MKTIRFFFLVLATSLTSQILMLETSESQKELLKQLSPDQRNSVLEQMNKANKIQEDIDTVFKRNQVLIERPELEDLDKEDICKECIYGYSLFKFSPSTFAPSSNTPVTSSYTLGPGDKIRVVLYGSQQEDSEEFISRDGLFNIPLLGPTNISGLTFSQASKFIESKVSKELIGVEASVSISQLRSITVYILGEAYKPGAYTLSALSTVTNALFVSGGVNEEGSLRNIKVKRNGKNVHSYDFYNLILRGDTSSDFRLEDGDTLFIPFIENTIEIGGAFKRPFKYEFLEGENLNDAIGLAGGFKFGVSANPKVEISTVDKSANARKIIYLTEVRDFEDYLLSNADAINVSEISNIAAEVMKISGEVKFPGSYSISKGDTVLDIINKAGGYTDLSFSEGAVFLRTQVAKQQKEAFLRNSESLERTLINIISSGAMENINEFSLSPLLSLIAKLKTQEPIGRQVVDLDYLNLKTDPYANFFVRGGDTIYIPRRPNSIVVTGEVLNAVTLRFQPDSSAKDYLELAGGLNEQADKSRIYVVQPNGQSKLLKRSLFFNNSAILPGSTIVVSRDSRPFDAVQLTTIITPILADLATSAAAIAAISND